MDDYSISRGEQTRLRWARTVVYVLPVVAGLITASVAFGQTRFQWPIPVQWPIPGGPHVGDAILIGNALLAGLASACAVSRLHPVEQGKLRRVIVAGLMTFLMAWVATVVFVRLLGYFFYQI